MNRILFICHGNICRSPMAEFIFKDLVKKQGIEKDFLIESAATSTEEIGNDMYPPAKEILRRKGVPFTKRGARQITKADYENYDLLIGMDNENYRNMNYKWNDSQNKIHLLMEYAGFNREVSDPWYTGDFESCYDDILSGCKGLLKQYLVQKNSTN